VLLLSFFVGAEQTGIYAAGRTLAFPLAFIGYAISSVLLPRFSRLAPVQLGPALWRASAQIAAVAAGVAVVVALGAPLAVRLLYGERYNGAAVMVVLLTLAYLTQWVSWPATTVLLALNRPDLILLVSLAMLGLTVGGYLLAIPRLGAPGVAWVYCAGCAIMVGPYMLLARRLIRERAAPQPAREAGPLLELP